jgi:plastocyanin
MTAGHEPAPLLSFRFLLAAALTLATVAAVGHLLPIAAQQAGTGTITGRVTTKAQPAAPVTVQVDQPVCGTSQPDPSLVTSADGGVAWAVILTTGVKGPSRSAPSVTNRQCRFDPHVQVASPGATLSMESADQTLHTTHAYGDSERSLFNIAIPIPGLKITKPLERAAAVRLGCDTHPWMRGYIVLSDDLSAVSDQSGSFTLSGVPAGTRELRIWHEKLKAAPQSVTVTAGGTAEVSFVLIP